VRYEIHSSFRCKSFFLCPSLSHPARSRTPPPWTTIFPNAQALAQLEIRAQQAGPRDQCFLYTELVHTMTEIAGRQMLNGDIDKASDTLKKVNH